MASPETLQIDAITATWAGASGAATDIDEVIGSPDTAYYGAGAEADAADFGFGVSEVIDGDTVTNITFNMIYRDDGTAGTLTVDVDLLIGGVVQGTTQTITVSGSDATYSNINHSGWNVDRTAAEMDGAELRLTPRQAGMPGTNAGFLETANMVVTFTPGVTALENGVVFDGTNDWLGDQSTSGETDSKTLLISGWLKPNGKQVSGDFLANIASDRFSIFFGDGGDATTNDISIRARNAALSIILLQRTDNLLVADQWNHFLFNFDLATAVAQGYINNAAVTFDGGGTLTNDTIDFTSTTGIAIGSIIGGATNLTDGALQEIWIGFGQSLDISVEANRLKFITADGLPADLGSDGSIPTSTQPTIYLRNEFSTFQNNLGSLGGFTENGALTDEGTKPALPAAGGITAGSLGLMGVGI